MSPSLSILVVDDERISRETTVQQLREAGYRAEACENAFRALHFLKQSLWDLILTDLRMPGMDGLEFLKEVRSRFPGTDVILMTAYGTVDTAVTAMQLGARDYLTKPFSFRELEFRLQNLTRTRDTERQLSALQTALDQSHAWGGLVGKSAAMCRVYERIELFAGNSAPVLITGETGTGKELVARAIHQKGPRASGPFVAVACGAIPREVAESELFGHEKGAFTGAVQRRRGVFERAHQGTVLLDDVDDLPLDIQVKLTRVLQESTLHRVGGEEEVRVDVRTIATSKVGLDAAVYEGRFRKDMYYRLRGLEILLPPLRERGDDILLLSGHFLQVLAGERSAEPKTLSPEVANVLRRYPWPGNVRELRRIIESAVAVCREPELWIRHLPDHLLAPQRPTRPFSLELLGLSSVNFNKAVQDFEDELIRWAMSRAGGEQQRAAELLGLPRTTLQSKVSRRRAS